METEELFLILACLMLFFDLILLSKAKSCEKRKLEYGFYAAALACGLIFISYSLLDMKDEALKMYKDHCEYFFKFKRSFYLIQLYDPFKYIDHIRSDPRFQEILAKHKELYEENLRKYGDIDL